MSISLPLFEPETADYIHIDSDNRVHLLLPIVGGETVGTDNTCKTALELKTFFYGKKEDAVSGEKAKLSALKVLEDYAQRLERDCQFLDLNGKFPELKVQKDQRLKQIQGYISILARVRSVFCQEHHPSPDFPAAIKDL